MTNNPDRRGGGSRDEGQGSRPGRVPPHNVDAEESAIGAALLNLEAADTLIERTTPADFYVPRNRHIVAAIRELRADGAPVDTITVGEQLRRMELLDEVGGGSYLHELQNATPAVSAAAHYTKIVRDAAVLRRLIYASADIAEAAYNGEDPGEAVAKAQDVLVRLATEGPADRGSTLDVADLAAILETDLQPEQGVMMGRSDGTNLLYAGKMHVFQAEPSSGKSWIALHAVREVLDVGGSAVYLDFEDTPEGITRRLLQLGARPSTVAENLVYVRPFGKHGPAEQLQLERILDNVVPDLVVIDGVGESLTRNGFSENEADDWHRWTDLLPRPITYRGATVLMIDHVAKDPEQRGRWARGTGAKLGTVDGASYQLKVVTPFSRKRAGLVKLVIAKDRPGGVGAMGETAALIKIEPKADGERVLVSVEPDTGPMISSDTWKPTGLMEKVSRLLEDSAVPLTASGIKATTHSSKPSLVSEAITRLIAEGYVEETRSKPKTLRSVKPYRGTDREAPPLDDQEPPEQQLFELDLPEEPDHVAADRRAYLDHLTLDTDPGVPDA